jgi:hypothetical protein
MSALIVTVCPTACSASEGVASAPGKYADVFHARPEREAKWTTEPYPEPQNLDQPALGY